jgi:hypothetical protein
MSHSFPAETELAYTGSFKISGKEMSLPFSAICDHTIAENGRKSQHNLSTGQKKVPKGQFLKASRNWQKCLALGLVSTLALA